MAKKKIVAKKKLGWKQPLLMIVYWAIYLTATMALFEHYHIVPGVVPFGVIGWMLIVEVPRVFIGWMIAIPLFAKK